jgi:putative tryptophan/tyrosine transport system substrate-binding protein
MSNMRRREVITLLRGAALAWPVVARAQQPAMPVIGFLSSGSPRTFVNFLKAFHAGLSDEGFVERRNVSIVYRWAEGHFDELDALATELVAEGAAVIAATGGMRSAEAAKNATTTIPVVFVIGFDPVKLGLVASFNKPGGNLTGTTIITTELATKRLSLLYDLDPGMRNVAILVNPESTRADVEIENVIVAARDTGRPLFVLRASSISEIDAAFASLAEQHLRALIISADPLFMTRRAQLVGITPSPLIAATATRTLGPPVAVVVVPVSEPPVTSFCACSRHAFCAQRASPQASSSDRPGDEMASHMLSERTKETGAARKHCRP